MNTLKSTDLIISLTRIRLSVYNVPIYWPDYITDKAKPICIQCSNVTKTQSFGHGHPFCMFSQDSFHVVIYLVNYIKLY